MIQSTLQMTERNDCTVRAIRDAYAVSYETAHEICARFGRIDGECFFVEATYGAKKVIRLFEVK